MPDTSVEEGRTKPSTKALAARARYREELRNLPFEPLFNFVKKGYSVSALEIGQPPIRLGFAYVVRLLVWQAMDDAKRASSLLETAQTESDPAIRVHFIYALGLLRNHILTTEIESFLTHLAVDTMTPDEIRAAALKGLVREDEAERRWDNTWPTTGTIAGESKRITLSFLTSGQPALAKAAAEVLKFDNVDDPDSIATMKQVLGDFGHLEPETLENLLDGPVLLSAEGRTNLFPLYKQIARESEHPSVRITANRQIINNTDDMKDRVEYLHAAFQRDPDSTVRARLLDRLLGTGYSTEAWMAADAFAKDVIGGQYDDDLRYEAACLLAVYTKPNKYAPARASLVRSHLRTALQLLTDEPILLQRIQTFLRRLKIDLQN